MRHHVRGRFFSRPSGQRTAMFRILVTDLLRNERIITTEAKAREVRGIAEKVITQGKKGTLHHRRLAASFLTDESVVRKLFTEIGPRYASRPGGYTRMVKLGPRRGDAAPMAVLELVS